MKKAFLVATVALLMGSVVAAANDGDKKNKSGKAKSEQCCKKTCTKPGKACCDKRKCDKS